MGIPRELLSYWENGVRNPSPAHLRALARIYRTTPEAVSDPEEELDQLDPVTLFADLIEGEVMSENLTVWSAFLDRWAEFLEVDLGRTLPGPSRPPAALIEGSMVYDRRRASALADEAREYWDLGQLALPELYAFVDDMGVLVYRQGLNGLGSGTTGSSGAFYNHAQLGFCVLVNDDVSSARQSFTLAHGISHVLYHYSEVGILCRVNRDDRLEQFADAFSQHFLVPGKELRKRARNLLDATYRRDLEPIDAVRLANLFRVSFPTMVMRLASESLVSTDTVYAWRRIDGHALATRFGLEAPGFPIRPGQDGPLGRYPASVLVTVRAALSNDTVPLDRAAEVLAVEPDEIADHLLDTPPTVSDAEQREHDEFELILAERT
jgi:Zn-dependent peptidase ImmA (M78 family)